MTPTPTQQPQHDRAVSELRIPALEIHQGPRRTLYTFAIDGKQLPKVAAVARVRRDDDSCLHGYQRPAVLAHIKAIRRYLESTDPCCPMPWSSPSISA